MRGVSRQRIYFYPRPPRGGRRSSVSRPSCSRSIHALREEGDLAAYEDTGLTPPISIHALREEGDGQRCYCLGADKAFLSTPSARRATVHHIPIARFMDISIHALREEGDLHHPLRP